MKPPATALHQWWAITSGSQAKWTARSRWARSPPVGLVPVGVASWALVPGVTWPKANEPASTTTTTETSRDNRRIADLPWFVSGCHPGSRERANLPRAATPAGDGPGVPVPDAAVLRSVIGVPAVISADPSRQEHIIPRVRGQHISRRYRVSGGPQQAVIRYTGRRSAQPAAPLRSCWVLKPVP